MNISLAYKKVKIIVKDSRIPLCLFFLWFLFGFFVYFFFFKLGFFNSLVSAFFFKEVDSVFSPAYNNWSQGIVFGVIFGILFQNMTARNYPERYSRLMAKETVSHFIIVGYSHLGKRIIGYLNEKNIPYVLIEKDREKVDELLRLNEAVIVDDATEEDALLDANISKARAVIITTDNLNASLLVTKRARELNKNCFILTRCFQDELAEVLESLGANEVISSSKNAFEDIARKLKL